MFIYIHIYTLKFIGVNISSCNVSNGGQSQPRRNDNTLISNICFSFSANVRDLAITCTHYGRVVIKF